MRQFLIAYLLLMLFPMATLAGDNDSYVNAYGGFLFPSTIHAAFGYEKETRYGNAYELSAQLGNRWEVDPVCGKVCSDSFWSNYYWQGTADYKKCITRYKNAILRIFGGVQAGAVNRSFFFGMNGGFEYNYALQNGIMLSVQQLNQINFRRGDSFRNGILVGFKIPL